MKNKLIVANWKMLPESLAQAQEILESTNDFLESLEFNSPTQDERDPDWGVGIVFCPPFVFTEEVAKIIKTSHLEHETSLGAQDIATEDHGAMTGEVSGPMLKNLGVRYVIIGHSERRWGMGESDEIVSRKLKSALRNEFTPIVCIGERTRDSSFKNFIKDQIIKTFLGLSTNEIERCIIAYEPVWAISTNPNARPDTPESALVSIRFIREFLAANYSLPAISTILYGGSVNPKNVSDFLAEREIDGILVGGASVHKEEFVKILKVAFIKGIE